MESQKFIVFALASFGFIAMQAFAMDASEDVGTSTCSAGGDSTCKSSAASLMQKKQKRLVAEHELYEDDGKNNPKDDFKSALSSLMQESEKPQSTPSAEADFPNGRDCWKPCHRRGGYCTWCGKGNACCRKDWRWDRKECKTAQFAEGIKGHHCVMVDVNAPEVKQKSPSPSPSPTPSLSPEQKEKTRANCTEGKINHQDYPFMCVTSALAVGHEISCPALTEVTEPSSSMPEYPHGLMTKNCPNAVLTTQCMTNTTYSSIVETITGMLSKLSDTCTASDCQKADWAGCVLRMAGHDFMDFDAQTNKGGADGCTDLNHFDNKGLAPCLHSGEHGASLLQAYEQVCSSVSLADFLVIAAEAVIHATGGPNFESQFKFGRTTSKTCPDAAHKLPDAEKGCPAVKTTFLDNLGLDWRGAAALMGVHSLGRAQPENSGYSGWWSDPENSRKFNNNYYISLRNKGWVPLRKVCGNDRKNQWIRSGKACKGSRGKIRCQGDRTEMMLDTDMCLAYHIPRGANDENCCAWLNRCHGDDKDGSGADNKPNINWFEKNGKKNPNACSTNWDSFAVAARMTSRQQLCGTHDEVADCGTKIQKSEFKGEIKGIGNRCLCKKYAISWNWKGEPLYCRCTTTTSLSGIAHEHITDFSSDQDAWFTAFRQAWGQVTTKGFANLRALQDTCPGTTK